MSFVNVQSHDFLKQLVQRLIGVGDNQSTLRREVVVDVGYDLHGHISFTRTGRTNNQGQAWLHSRADSFHLSCSKGNGIPKDYKKICISNMSYFEDIECYFLTLLEG
jgi:hypothetical protein